jgi:hypothetical protein
MNAKHAAQQVLMLLQQYAPEQRAAARGLTYSEIDRLELEIQRHFCMGHRVFLEHFGATPKGALNPLLYDFEFNDAAIRQYHRTRRDNSAKEWVFWANVGAGRYPRHAYARDRSVEDPALGSPELSEIHYESMWNDILFDAYVFLIEERFEHREPGGWLWEGRNIALAEAAEPFALVQRLLINLGFDPWIDMANAQCMMRSGEVVVWFGRTGTMPGPDEWNFSICGPDPQQLREIREILADNAGLVDRPVRAS